MADVFISYRKSDRARAEALAKALRVENVDVWWDDNLETGETFDEKIQSVLNQAKAVIVVWSKESVKSDWVRAESFIGRDRGVLVPVMIQPVNIPVPFNVLHTANLAGWHGDRAHAGYRDVVKQVKELAGKSHVPPLKPPPNPALRALWRAVAAVAVVAVAGASLWWFQPWKYWQPEVVKEMVAEAKAKSDAQTKRDASLAKLAAYGLKPTDIDQRSPVEVARKIFKDETWAQLQADALLRDPLVLTLRCHVALYGTSKREPNEQNALDICKEAADAGDAAGHVAFARALIEETTFVGMDVEALKEASLSQYKTASDMGYGWGQVKYGEALRKGEGVASNPTEAERLFKLAQAQGLPAADRALGMLYLSGDVPGPSDQQSFAMIRKAADNGDVAAQSFMGDALAEGIRVTGDAEAAANYYRACADSGDTDFTSWCTRQIWRDDKDRERPQ